MSNIDQDNPPRILIIAALAAESAPFIQMLHPLSFLSGSFAKGTWKKFSLSVLTCGVGEIAARSSTAKLLQHSSFDYILNVGTCGALQDDLPIGSICKPSRIINNDGAAISLAELDLELTLITVTTAINTPQKRALLAPQAQICDMEAYGIAEEITLQRPKIPFSMIKVVSDLAGGEPDSAMTRGPRAERIVQFKKRAFQLSRLRLLPHVQQWLEHQIWSPS